MHSDPLMDVRSFTALPFTKLLIIGLVKLITLFDTATTADTLGKP